MINKEAFKRSTLWRGVLQPIYKTFRKVVPGRYELARSLYHRCVTGGEMIVRAENLDGQFHVSAKSDLAARICLLGTYEPELTHFLEEKLKSLEGDVINIGANVGLMSIHIARRYPSIRRVFAIEPQPEAYRALVENVALNNCTEKVFAINKCISNHEGLVEFAFISGKPEYSSIGGVVHSDVDGEKVETVEIPAQPLDAVLREHDVFPALLLIDVEGAEKLVLEGALDVLKTHRPIIIFELSATLLAKFGHRVGDIVILLQELGYTVEDVFGLESIDDNFDGEAFASVPK